MSRYSRKATQFLWATLKILIVVVAGYFVYRKLSTADFWQLQNHLATIDINTVYLYITILFSFSTLNWFFEIKKWQTLTSAVTPLPFKLALQQVFTAHLTGFVTPAKAGDYGAKALFFTHELRKKILFLNLLGNMYQLLATLLFGLVGLGIIAFFTSGTAIFFWLMMVMFCLLFYFIFPRVLNRVRWSLAGNSWAKVRSYFKTIPKRLKKRVQQLSALRYLIFAHQFYVILWMLGNEQSYIFAMACITAVYLLSSLIPVMQLFDLIIRGGIAVLVFGWFSVPEETILSAVLVMWVLNVFLPLLPGTYFLLSRKQTAQLLTSSLK